ncbi:Senescence-associated family protein [Brugia pahangi]
MAKNIADETVDTVKHKWGNQASIIAHEALYATGHTSLAALQLWDLGPRSIAGRAARKAGTQFEFAARPSRHFEVFDDHPAQRPVEFNQLKGGLMIHVFAKIVEVRNIRSVDILENVQIASVIYLRDSSTDSFIRCTLYSKLTDTFSEEIKTDQIIQLNHIHIRTNPGRLPSLYGKLNDDGLTIVLISDHPGSGYNVVFHSCANYSLPENCQEMIAVLQIYSNNVPVASSAAISVRDNTLGFSNGSKTICRLNQLVRFQYHNIVVQAVSVFISDRNNVVLRCWDTTKPPSSTFFFGNENISEIIHIDEELSSLAQEYLCDVIFYNEHGACLKKTVKPGDILLLINMHYYVMKDNNMLAVHEGGKRYNRGIRILDDSSSHKAKLLKYGLLRLLIYAKSECLLHT